MSDWVDITPPDELERVNETAVAKQAGGYVWARVLWNRTTNEIRAKYLTAEGLAKACEENADARMSADFREGVAAFLEKRKPRWPQPGA